MACQGVRVSEALAEGLEGRGRATQLGSGLSPASQALVAHGGVQGIKPGAACQASP